MKKEKILNAISFFTMYLCDKMPEGMSLKDAVEKDYSISELNLDNDAIDCIVEHIEFCKRAIEDTYNIKTVNS